MFMLTILFLICVPENPKHRVKFSNLCLTFFGLLFYITDICTDIMLALWYLRHGHYLFCALTFVPIYLATAIDLVSSWFRNELNNKESRFWFKCIALSLFHLWGIKIIWDLLQLEYEAYKSQRVNADMHKKVTKKTIRAAWLRFNEGAYEASIQTVLQPSILRYITEIREYFFSFLFISIWPAKSFLIICFSNVSITVCIRMWRIRSDYRFI